MDTIEEVWETIPDYPGYSVSNHGHVMNNRTERLVKPQFTNHGVVYVPLWGDNMGSTRSVKVLVAKAFLEGETDVFDTPINKDGDKSNNHIDNLLWRPRWFANKYSRQFLYEYQHANDGPVFDVETEIRYDTVYIVGIMFGLLFRDVFRSAFSGTEVFPTRQIFRIPTPIQVR